MKRSTGTSMCGKIVYVGKLAKKRKLLARKQKSCEKCKKNICGVCEILKHSPSDPENAKHCKYYKRK